jgi:hypothetical protein
LSRGWARQRELARESEAERSALTAAILAGLGRQATTIDMIAASNLAALYVRANKLDAAGRDATEIRRQINQALRTTGFRPAKAEPPKQPSIAEQLAARGYAPPVARTDKAAPETLADETHNTEVPSASSEAVS